MDERLRFVAQLLDGEAISEVCRAFGIDRVPGDGVRAAVSSRSPAGLAGFPQAATAGSEKIGSSLNGAMVSRVM